MDTRSCINCLVEANALSIPPGEYGRKLKLKGIDGDPHKQWSMWFNSIQREEPYLGLNCRHSYLKGLVILL